jgi:HEAT repeat protein
MNFVQKIIEDGFKIASEDPSLSVAVDDQQATPPGMAIQMLHAYACAVPNEKVYPIFKDYLQKYSTSQNEHERAAAVYILGFIADSDACLDPIRDDITPMTNYLVEKMSDDSFVVREAAGEAVGRFAENVGDDFLNKHKQILPCLLKVLKDLQTSKQDLAIQKALCALNELV